MLTKHAERYVLRSCSEPAAISASMPWTNSIERQPSLDRAWIFHSHDGAVTHALWIGEVHGETPDVVKLDL